MTINAARIFFPVIGIIGQANAAGLTAKITTPDGATRTAELEGVGCAAALCSRVAMKAEAQHVLVEKRLDAIGTIKNTSASNAVLVMKDGTAQRVSLMKDFRVLYLVKPSGGTEKVDLANVKSVEFLGK
jgi:hypothetical protein